MRTLNLGDSGYMILRPKADSSDLEKTFRSKEQQHRFNAPYQTGMRYHSPKTLAFDSEHLVQHNDIVVMGTDGVYDNLHDEQIIESCVKPNLQANGDIPSPEKVANCVSYLAEAVSYSETIETPWTVNAVAHGRDRAKNIGGKQDDITVIIAQVKLS